MRKLRESKAMWNDLVHCLSIAGFSAFMISNHPNLRPWHRAMAAVGLVCLILYAILCLWQMRRNKRMTPGEQREARRENSDERSRMIQNKATQYCWEVENALLLIGLVVFVFRDQPAVYSVLYAVLVVRILACTALRWWLERKY